MKKDASDLHERARRLIDAERVEGLHPDERRWLQDHLAECEACSEWAGLTEATLGAIKSVSVALPPGLAASAALSLRERAQELRHRRARNLGIAVGCALSWAVGVASAPLVWKAWAWLGATFDLPRVLWEMGFICWWFVPAAAAGLVIAWVRRRPEQESAGISKPRDTPSRPW